MDVITGVQKTELGVIPADWSAEILEHMVDSSRSIRYGIVQPGKFDPRGRYLVRGQDYSRGWVDPSELFRVGSIIEERYANARIRTGDILITIVGASTGRIAVVPSWLDDANLTQTTARIAINNARASSAYCSYVLSSWYGTRQVQNYIKGGAQPGLNCGDLEKFLIPLPPTKAEQEAIAEALSDADTLIESLEQLLAKKRHIKQGAMQKLLTGKKRLPGFSGEWKVMRLGELADIRSGGTPSTAQSAFWDGDILWCTPTDITALDGHKYLQETNRRITQDGLKNSSAEMIPPQSIVMTSRATIGECAINTVPVSTNQGFKNFVTYEFCDTEFLYYLLMTQKQGFVSLCGGSTFLEIGKTQLIGYEVRLPETKREQTAIAAILSDMDTDIAMLEAKLAKARALKQGMMQELLTGRIRLV